jgi:hypothetical protein
MDDLLYPLPAEGRSLDDILKESDDFFAGRGSVHTTIRRLSQKLRDERIDYALLGGMALNAFGYRRETVDVDVLLTPEGLRLFRERFLGRGYNPAFSGATKSFRDVETGVKIDVVTSGEYPGDGKPKPVAFPDPASSSLERDGYSVIVLEKLIELKIASGLSSAHRRLIDLADVQRLIEEVRLPLELAEKLDPSVREEYRRLWNLAQGGSERPQERR